MTSQLVLIILGSFSLGLLTGVFAAAQYFSIKSESNDSPYVSLGKAGNPVTASELVEEQKPLAEFPIAGKPRRVPWAVKRRDIEQQHRTKRKRMEEWL